MKNKKRSLLKIILLAIVLPVFFAFCWGGGFLVGRKNCEIYKIYDVNFFYYKENPLYLVEKARIFTHLLDLLKRQDYDEALTFIAEKQAYYTPMAEDRVKKFSHLEKIYLLGNNLTIEEKR